MFSIIFSAIIAVKPAKAENSGDDENEADLLVPCFLLFFIINDGVVGVDQSLSQYPHHGFGLQLFMILSIHTLQTMIFDGTLLH